MCLASYYLPGHSTRHGGEESQRLPPSGSFKDTRATRPVQTEDRRGLVNLTLEEPRTEPGRLPRHPYVQDSPVFAELRLHVSFADATGQVTCTRATFSPRAEGVAPA